MRTIHRVSWRDARTPYGALVRAFDTWERASSFLSFLAVSSLLMSLPYPKTQNLGKSPMQGFPRVLHLMEVRINSC
ncbi:hypothetical protein Y032_0045g1131 [Ancylostoma ceylanicum]|uniref:Uncharacterized protein n=1 Tax=Ancylostoma ceylanicum TaxID=53326 RepID=A0A016UCH7_9BILA|nr:hypothetical protein Y032_0045g1131 [Ancylostoma ceylanicum]